MDFNIDNISCDNCKFLDECDPEWMADQGGCCENWETSSTE